MSVEILNVSSLENELKNVTDLNKNCTEDVEIEDQLQQSFLKNKAASSVSETNDNTTVEIGTITLEKNDDKGLNNEKVEVETNTVEIRDVKGLNNQTNLTQTVQMETTTVETNNNKGLKNESVQVETINPSSTPIRDVDLDFEGGLTFIDDENSLKETDEINVIISSNESESSKNLNKKKIETTGATKTNSSTAAQNIPNKLTSAVNKTKNIIKPEKNMKNGDKSPQSTSKTASQTRAHVTKQPVIKAATRQVTKSVDQPDKKSATQPENKLATKAQSNLVSKSSKGTINQPGVKRVPQLGMKPSINAAVKTTAQPRVRSTKTPGTKTTQPEETPVKRSGQPITQNKIQPTIQTTSQRLTKASHRSPVTTSTKTDSKNTTPSNTKTTKRPVSTDNKLEISKKSSPTIKSATQSKPGVGKVAQIQTVSSAKSRSTTRSTENGQILKNNKNNTSSAENGQVLKNNKNNSSSTENGQILKTIKNKETGKQGKGIKMPNANSLVSDDLNKMSFSMDATPTPLFSRQMSIGDQAIIFKDTVNPRVDFDQLSKLISESLDEKEKECLKDLKEYLIKKEDAWVLDQKLLNFIGGLLDHRSLNPDIRARMLRLLAAGALRQDFWSFLQMDRKNRHLMKYANDFPDLQVEEQKAICLFLCNNFSSGKGSEWLLYGSTWQLEDGKDTCNVRITSRVAGYSLVSYTPSLQDYGSALIYNIALKEAKALSVPVNKYTEEGLPTVDLEYGSVTDKDIMGLGSSGNETQFVTLKIYNDIAMELSMAILKYIKKTKNPQEEILYRCVKSLVKFSFIIRADILSSIAMVHVDLDAAVPGVSSRIDNAMAQLKQQLLKAN